MNIKFAGSGALHDSQAAIRRLKTVKPQAGHLNLDESVIEVGFQAAPRDMLHPAVRYLIPDSPDRPHLADKSLTTPRQGWTRRHRRSPHGECLLCAAYLPFEADRGRQRPTARVDLVA